MGVGRPLKSWIVTLEESIPILLGRRVEDLPLELGVLWLDFNVLHDDDFIIDTHCIGRQRRGIYRTLDGVVHGEVFERATILAFFEQLLAAFASPFFGRVIRVGLLVGAICLGFRLCGGFFSFSRQAFCGVDRLRLPRLSCRR